MLKEYERVAHYVHIYVILHSLKFSPMLQLTSMVVDGVKISFPYAWARLAILE